MKALKYFACFLFLTLTSRIYSQIPDTIWTKTFGGSLADVGNSVKQTNDSGFIVAGTTSSFGAGGQDIYLIKTDENGDTLWTKTFGGAGNDRAANVVQTNDNGYAIFGTTNSFGDGGDDFLLWKTDSLGNNEWYKTYGTNLNEIASGGQKTFDEGYIIVGYFQYNQDIRGWAIKVDKFGNYVWGKILLRSNYSDLWPSSVVQTADDGYVIGCTWGYTYFGGYRHDWLTFKLSAAGDSLYYREYTNVGADFLISVRNTDDGNLILGGSTAYQNIWLLKTTLSGGTIWSSIIPIPGSGLEFSITSLEIDNDDGFVITGRKIDANIYLYKTNNYGILQWTKFINTSAYDRAYSVCATSDNGYIVTGETEQIGAGGKDIWLLKFKYSSPPINVQINFFPQVDTALVNGGCTTPEIICKNLSSTNERDSISIEPGFNTYFYYYDSTGTQIPLDNYYFIVIDSLDEYDYELWFNPKSWPPYDPVIIPFDSLFSSEQNNYDIQLIVKKNGMRIDSLSQPFHADFGLSVDDSGIFPNEFSLSQNYPNPFNPVTSIQYAVSSTQFVTLKVYDILGNEIATLVNEEKQPGSYEVEFNTSSIKHLPSSGIYFYQLRAGEFVETKKMMLLR